MRAFLLTFGLLLMAGCVETSPTQFSADTATNGVVNFADVSRRVEAVAERECRARLRGVNCDFVVLIETDPRAGLNAFQTIDRNGRPIILVTTELIEAVRNPDELALVIGHEAAHHIWQHIPEQMDAARRGALVFGVIAQLGGADEAAVQEAAQMGAAVGVQRYSQEHELEADQLGTIIAAGAGYDPILGSRFFNRLPDPGNRLYSSHPPNAQRQAMIRRTAEAL